MLIYEGKPISILSSNEAAKLIDEEGYFGIKKTSKRMAGFVINGAGEDLNLLKIGRDSVLRGLSQAEELWVGKLPKITYKTLEKSLRWSSKNRHFS